MPFLPGRSGNPAGGKKGPRSGRMHALNLLDGLLQDEGVLETLRDGLQKALERDPVWFFRRIVMPLLPKEASLNVEHNGVIEWRLLSDTPPIGLRNKSIIPVTGDSVLSVPDDDSERPSALPENCSSVHSSTPASTDG